MVWSTNTRVLVGVDVVEIVALFAELHTGGAVPELLHEKGGILLHDLPNQLPWNCRHFTFPCNSTIDDSDSLRKEEGEEGDEEWEKRTC